MSESKSSPGPFWTVHVWDIDDRQINGTGSTPADALLALRERIEKMENDAGFLLGLLKGEVKI